MNRKAKGSRRERLSRKILKELGYSLLGFLLVVVIIGFVICMRVGSWFISPLVYVGRVVRKKVERSNESQGEG